MNQTNNKRRIDLLNGIFVLATAAGIVTGIRILLAGRSLWLDEAWLAEGIVTRDLLHLLSSSLPNIQSAPGGYLMVVKLLTLLLGESENVLRLYSLFSFLLCLPLLFGIGNAMGLKYPLFPVAFFSNTVYLLRYSNECKQYMSEALWCLLIFYLYLRWSKKHPDDTKQLYLLTGVMCLSLLMANPAIFVIGAIMAYEFFRNIFLKRFANAVCIGIHSLCILAVFGLYYYLWLRLCNVTRMQDSWQLQDAFFSLNLASLQRLYWIWDRIRRPIPQQAVRYAVDVLLLCVLGYGILRGMKEKKAPVWLILLTVGYALLASALRFFPTTERVWLFLYPFMMLLLGWGLECVLMKFSFAHRMRSILLVGMLLLAGGSAYYLDAEKMYYATDDANPLIAYVDSHIRQGEYLYLYKFSIPVFKYKQGYACTRIGETPANDNILWGTSLTQLDTTPPLTAKEVAADLAAVRSHTPCYIIGTHFGFLDESIDGYVLLMKELEKTGSLSLVAESHGTYLYLYDEP
ncbi:MAG: hypothetical protein IJR17_02665 [Clostridia bacterium]|nr:hypothetical protein [Clostridia bacterium]